MKMAVRIGWLWVLSLPRRARTTGFVATSPLWEPRDSISVGVHRLLNSAILDPAKTSRHTSTAEKR